MAANEILVSFDVTLLFTNIPTDEAVDVIHRRLLEDEEPEERTPLSPDRIAELLRLCLKSTYFSYDGEFYEQREGAAMGSPVSAIIANLYIEFFEELALDSAPCRPRLWKRYVNDTCCILKKDAVDGLLHHLNRVRPPIKFTMELEKNGSLPFLDANLTPSRGQLSGAFSTEPGTSHYRRRTGRRKKTTSPLLSSRMATLYHSFVPSPPFRNHLHHQKTRMMRNRRRSHWW